MKKSQTQFFVMVNKIKRRNSQPPPDKMFAKIFFTWQLGKDDFWKAMSRLNKPKIILMNLSSSSVIGNWRYRSVGHESGRMPEEDWGYEESASCRTEDPVES